MLKDEKTGNYIKDTLPYEEFKNSNNDILTFYMKYNHLKNLYRQGWLKIRIGLEHKDKCESVADHSFSMALLALSMIEKYNLPYDTLKCLKMCIIHELGEIYVGDYTPYDNITKDEKHNQEKKAVREVIKDLDFNNDFIEIWEEFEEVKTPEAIFIKNLDQLEFLLQAASYGCDASYFKKSIEKITDEHCKKIVEDLLKETRGKKKPLVIG